MQEVINTLFNSDKSHTKITLARHSFVLALAAVSGVPSASYKIIRIDKGWKRSPKWTSIYVLINPQDESWIYFKPSWHSLLPPSVISTHCPVRWQLPRSTIWMFTIISKHKSGPASRLFSSTRSQIRSRWQLWGPFTSFLCFALTLTRSVLGKSWTQ